MAGKVFLSCGQSLPAEKETALKIKEILEKEYGLKCYVAFKVQSLSDIMKITEELKNSDYYLFIDFIREINKPQGIPISIFTHQELAIAQHVRFENIIAFQQKDAPLQGFLKYMLSNPEIFDNSDDLLKKLRNIVSDKGWNADYSRNLTVEENGFVGPLQYADHTGANWERVYQVKVCNNRPEVAAVRTVCVLDNHRKEGAHSVDSPDRSYLKWAGQQGYERTLLPKDYGFIDLFAIRAGDPGLYLHSICDVHPRSPIIYDNGTYILSYKLFSEGFPMIRFSVKVNLNWEKPQPSVWKDLSDAELLEYSV